MFKLFIQILKAFETLSWKEILHRDIKPDNFMIEFEQLDFNNFESISYKTKFKVLLIDFGLSKDLDKDSNPMPSEPKGNFRFSAPE